MKPLFLFVLLLSLSACHVQGPVKLSQKRIDWVGEYTSGYQLGSHIDSNYNFSDIQIVKLDYIPGNTQQLDFWYFDLLALPERCFADAQLTQQLDANTYQNLIQQYASKVPDYYMVRQQLYHDERTYKIGSTVLAIAPVFDGKPLLWLMPAPKGSNLKPQPEIAFRTETIMDGNIWLQQHRLIKHSRPLPDILHGMFASKSPKIKRSIHGASYDQRQPISPKRARFEVYHPDTAVVFDPETYEEVWTPTFFEILPQQIEKLKLIQTWYYDTQSKCLSSEIQSVGLMVAWIDDRGNVAFHYVFGYLDWKPQYQVPKRPKSAGLSHSKKIKKNK